MYIHHTLSSVSFCLSITFSVFVTFTGTLLSLFLSVYIYIYIYEYLQYTPKCTHNYTEIQTHVYTQIYVLLKCVYYMLLIRTGIGVFEEACFPDIVLYFVKHGTCLQMYLRTHRSVLSHAHPQTHTHPYTYMCMSVCIRKNNS